MARPGFRTAVVSVLLFCGTILLFRRAADFGFVNYDDPNYVTDNPHVQDGLTWAGVVWAFTAPLDYWHPLTWLLSGSIIIENGAVLGGQVGIGEHATIGEGVMLGGQGGVQRLLDGEVP